MLSLGRCSSILTLSVCFLTMGQVPAALITETSASADGLRNSTATPKSQSTDSLSKDLTRYVDPFIGTDAHGHTFLGATVPFGMVQLSPDTRLTGWDSCSG